MLISSRETGSHVTWRTCCRYGTRVRGNGMQIGIAAPEDIRVLRSRMQEPIGEPPPESVPVPVGPVQVMSWSWYQSAVGMTVGTRNCEAMFFIPVVFGFLL